MTSFSLAQRYENKRNPYVQSQEELFPEPSFTAPNVLNALFLECPSSSRYGALAPTPN